ncbi:MAG: hypothetical protein GXP49_10605 [Deltaproteobacteria bacterium]|nr:hypothetical protein [Deltaproteobacteria bacterium]
MESAISFDRNLNQVINLTSDMLALAAKGDQERHDPWCGIVYGVLRDAAYKLRRLAEKELIRHKEKSDMQNMKES